MRSSQIATTDAKNHFTEIINRVAHEKERIILTRRGKEIAAIISIEDLQLLLGKYNQNELNEAIDALKQARENGTKTLNEFKRELGE